MCDWVVAVASGALYSGRYGVPDYACVLLPDEYAPALSPLTDHLPSYITSLKTLAAFSSVALAES